MSMIVVFDILFVMWCVFLGCINEKCMVWWCYKFFINKIKDE